LATIHLDFYARGSVATLNLNTQLKAPRIGPHTRLTWFWKAVFGSLILDGLILLLEPGAITPQLARLGAILCALLTLPFIDQEKLARGLALLRSRPSDTKSDKSKLVKIGIVLAVALALMIKLSSLPEIRSVAALAIAAILVFGAWVTIQHVLKTLNEQRDLIASSPAQRVKLWENQIVAIVALPIIAARAPSLLGALSYSQGDSYLVTLSCLATTVLLLMITKPKRSAYIGSCRRCKAPVPVAYVSYGSCPGCDKGLREL
jgi:hypothetical protein